MKFDPDKAHVKVRGMNGVHYEQGGHKFSAGFAHIGKLKENGTGTEPVETKDDIRARAAAKIAAKRKRSEKKGDLDGFREKESPDAVSSAAKENEAAKKAEELAGD